MALSRRSGDRTCRRRAAARRALPLTSGGRAQDHRDPLVGAAVLRAESIRRSEAIMETAEPMLRRCPIYTRRSSEEGLEQNFNSLHAQREACVSFSPSAADRSWWTWP